MQNESSKHPCVILDSLNVIPDSMRNAVTRKRWIADRARPGLRSGVRNDQAYVIPHSIREPFTQGTWIADQVPNDQASVIPDSIRDPVHSIDMDCGSRPQ